VKATTWAAAHATKKPNAMDATNTTASGREETANASAAALSGSIATESVAQRQQAPNFAN
jgi:hypothetical protein